MATREAIMTALEALLTDAYPFNVVGRRNVSPETLASPGRPALMLLKSHEIYERSAPNLPPRRTMIVKAIVYIDTGADPAAIPDAMLNPIQDAIDVALKPDDALAGRCTLGRLVHSAMIKGDVPSAPGDKTGKGLVVIPIEIILP